MNKIGLKVLFLILIFATVLPSCSVTKLIPEGQYLVTKNRVHIAYTNSVRNDLRIKNQQPLDYIPLSQTPNARVFGADVRTWLYMQSDSTKNNWWNKTLRKMGQPPIYFDSTQTIKSANNMQIFMASEGFLDNTITTNVTYKNKRAYIDYNINAESVYIIDSIKYNIFDENIKPYILADSADMLLQTDKAFTRNILNEERKRITKSLMDIGFYSFTASNIDYLIDTTHNDHKAYVQINVNKQKKNGELVNHKKYKIRDIYVYPNFNGEISPNSVIDTVEINNISYLYQNGDINIKASALKQKIRFGIDHLWSPKYVQETNQSFLNMKYYRTSSIDFKQIEAPDSTDYNYLDSYIRLIPSKINGIKLEGEVASNSSYTSILARLGYSNKNIFKHSEVFEINFDVGYDLFYSDTAGDPNDDGIQIVQADAYQIGVEASLSFPKLIVPFKVKSHRYINNIESSILIGYNIQNRPDYKRNIATTSFGYKWSDSRNLWFTYNPISLSFISLPRVNQDYLDNIQNEYLRETYKDQLIAATTFGLIYNKERPIGNNYTVKVNVETAGNTLRLGGIVFNQEVTENDIDEEFYDILNVRYAQYARMDVNFSYKYNFNNKSALVTRLYGGIGVGYGNSNVMPFERQFYSGGNASMRGWTIRSLGPGESININPNSTYPNSTGDIRLEMNIEGRFPIFGPLRGAIFLDVGNIWSNGKEEIDKKKVFYIDTFYKQLGFNTGLGLRLDLSFFVLRLDWGIILHNPNKEAKDRWINNFNLDNTALHFAIGYPF